MKFDSRLFKIFLTHGTQLKGTFNIPYTSISTDVYRSDPWEPSLY